MYGSYSELYATWCTCYDPKGIEISTIEKYYALKNKDVLDAGCGTGRFLFRVLPIVKKIIGIDNDIDSIKVLKRILFEKYDQLSSKVKICCNNIEKYNAGNETIDLAIFSWSFYALNKEQMVHSLSNINSMLRADGVLIILQPVGGDFEEIMRMFFDKHEDMDEYIRAIRLMNEITDMLYTQIATDKIISEFVVKDLEMMCDVLKMFAFTEGECHETDLTRITQDRVRNILEKYRKSDGYHLGDEVSLFVYKKKEA